MKKVLVPVGNGTEEIEAVCIIDVLRRANVDVFVASVETTKTVVCARKTKIEADRFIGDVVLEKFDCIALPGGMPGAERLRDSVELTKMLHEQSTSGRFYAAICAAPAVVLATHGLLVGKVATCYPAAHFQSVLPDLDQTNSNVIVSGNCITSRGPATALEFGLKLVEVLCGKEEADKVQAGLLFAKA